MEILKVKSDLIKLKNDFVSIIVSPFKWDISGIINFLVLLAVLTIAFF